MPVHDWTQVDAGTFHDFHNTWIIHLKDTMNRGRLPAGYYVMSEQHYGLPIADILTLREPGPPAPPPVEGGVLLMAPPRTSRRLVASSQTPFLTAQKTLAVRHVSGHQVVAMIEIASPANKDRPKSVARFADKIFQSLRQGIHVLLIDLLPPGPADPAGLHGAVWDLCDGEVETPPQDRPLSLASYLAAPLPEAEVEYVAVGEPVPDMPINLRRDLEIGVPLRESYESAFQAMPAYWRRAISGESAPNT